MSKEHRESITCPKCGKKSDFTVWESLNTMLDPDEKPKVISGDLFRFTCPECGAVTTINYPMLYHQMEDHMMIYYVLSEEAYEQAYEFCTGKKTNGEDSEHKLSDIFGDAMSNYLYRIVLSQNSLREKIRIFDDGKDDRIIEIMKLFVGANIHNQQPEIEDFELYYDGSLESNDFAIVTAEGPPMHASVPEGVYEEMQESFSKRLPDIRDKKDLLIDADWAMRFISSEE